MTVGAKDVSVGAGVGEHFSVVVFHEEPAPQLAVADLELIMLPVTAFLSVNVVPPYATATAMAL
jgi:hypothetical protein